MSAPLRTAYKRGRELEHRIRAELLAAGYQVSRGAGSRGAGDRWAAKLGGDGTTLLLFVQVKRGGMSPLSILSVAAWNALLDAARAAGGLPILATAAPRCATVYWRILGPRLPHGRARTWEEFAI